MSAKARLTALSSHLTSSSPTSSSGSVQEPKFHGWLGHDPSAAEGNMKWEEYTPKTWAETDIDIKISCCGICGSDIHTLRSGWGTTNYPVCVGHEIIGTAIRIGTKAEGGIKVGDRVGVGAQASSCLQPDCQECSEGIENHCPKGNVGTYNGKYKDGSRSYGGYAEYIRIPSHFVFKIPEVLKSEEAAVMLCAGITTYSPLVRNGVGPDVKVGVVGIGGLGHFAILWAKALGSTSLTAISRTTSKKHDAFKLGATNFIATEDPTWSKKNSQSLDLIISTIAIPDMPIMSYLRLLRTRGQFIQVGAPEEAWPGFHAFTLVGKGLKIGGSMIGSPQEIRDMLDLAVEKSVRPWVEVRSMKDANKVVVDMEKGRARYRYVLVNDM